MKLSLPLFSLWSRLSALCWLTANNSALLNLLSLAYSSLSFFSFSLQLNLGPTSKYTWSTTTSILALLTRFVQLPPDIFNSICPIYPLISDKGKFKKFRQDGLSSKFSRHTCPL